MDIDNTVNIESKRINSLAFDPNVQMLWIYLSGCVQYSTDGMNCRTLSPRISTLTYRVIRKVTRDRIDRMFTDPENGDWCGRLHNMVIACAKCGNDDDECIVFRKTS